MKSARLSCTQIFAGKIVNDRTLSTVFVERVLDGELIFCYVILSSCSFNLYIFSFRMQFKLCGVEVHRKEIYTSLSLIVSIFLFAILVNDFIAVITVETPENNSHSFTFSILVSKWNARHFCGRHWNNELYSIIYVLVLS